MRYMVGREIARFSSGFGHPVRLLLEADTNEEVLLVTTVPNGSEVTRWDISTGERVWCYDEGTSGCNDEALVHLPDGGVLLAIATEDGVEWWDALTGRYCPEMTWEDWTIWALSVGSSPDGRPLLFGAGHNGSVYRWDATNGQLLGATPEGGGRGSMMAVEYLPLRDGRGLVVSGDDSGRIWRWDAWNGSPIVEPTAGNRSRVHIIRALPVAGDAMFVSSDGEGAVLERWSALAGTPLYPSVKSGTDVYALATANVEGAAVMFAAGADNIVRAWDAVTGEPIGLSAEGTVVSVFTQSNGEVLMATSTARGDVIVYEFGSLAE
ncbi:WD40 repeat domain-containing protein [Streptomyces sp. NPDC058891]|uniref:WD40 repeat domain-containing protein n=1 Tax=Streptomyces sp. NPDC058891 TaxID=3346667 RepID=UPI0036B27E9A